MALLEPNFSDLVDWFASPDQEDPKTTTKFAQEFQSRHMIWSETLSALYRSGKLPWRGELTQNLEVIGAGASFEVWRTRVPDVGYGLPIRAGTDIEQREYVALKRVRPDRNLLGQTALNKQARLDAVHREIKALFHPTLRRHENIARLLNIVWERRTKELAIWPALIMQYYPFSLAELQEDGSRKQLSFKVKTAILRGIRAGLEAIHDASICHGDIKSENILLEIQADSVYIPKLTDFGGSIISIGDALVVVGGTSTWQAPECTAPLRVEALPLTDLYSYGLLVWRVLIEGMNPFNEDESISAWTKLSDVKSKGIAMLKQQTTLARIASQNLSTKLKGLGNEMKESVDFWAALVARFLLPSPLQRLMNPDISISLGFDLERATYREYLDVHGYAKWGKAPPTRLAGADPNISPTNLFTEVGAHAISMSTGEDSRTDPGEDVKHQLFNEIFDAVKWVDDNSGLICERCSRTTSLDRQNLPQQAYSIDAVLAELSQFYTGHTCHLLKSDVVVASPVPALGSFNRASSILLALISCYTVGYGVEKTPLESMRWLLQGARWGMSRLVTYAVRMSYSHNVPIEQKFPVKTMLVAAVVVYNDPSACKALARIDCGLLQIARSIRRLHYNGIRFDTSNATWPFESLEDLVEDQSSDSVLNRLGNRLRDFYAEPSIKVFFSPKTTDLTTYEQLSPTLFDRKFKEIADTAHMILDDSGNTILHYVAGHFFGTPKAIEAILKRRPGLLDKRNDDGDTPLLVACRSDNVCTAMELLHSGADATLNPSLTNDGPLHWAARFDSTSELIEELVDCGADPNGFCLAVHHLSVSSILINIYEENRVLGSPLLWAVKFDSPNAVKALLKSGADCQLANGNGPTPLEVAITMRKPRMLDLMLSHLRGKRLNFHIYFRILAQDSTDYHALFDDYDETDEEQTLDVLLNHCNMTQLSDIHDYFFGTFTIILSSWPLQRIKRFVAKVKRWCEPYFAMPGNRNSLSPNKHVLQILQVGMEALHTAVRKSDVPLLRYLLEEGFDPSSLEARDSMFNSALHTVAAGYGGIECALVLLESGIDLDLTSGTGITAYQHALLAGNCEVAQLIKVFMTPEQEEAQLWIHIPRRNTHIRFSILLAECGGLLDTKIRGLRHLIQNEPDAVPFIADERTNITMLHTAVGSFDVNIGEYREMGRLPVLRVMLEAFPGPEHINCVSEPDGLTALHYCAMYGNYEEAQMLVEAGAYVTIQTYYGLTPLDLCFTPITLENFAPVYVPTREMMTRWCHARNAVARYLRSKGSRRCQAFLPLSARRDMRQEEPFPDVNTSVARLLGIFEARTRRNWGPDAGAARLQDFGLLELD